MQSKISEEVMFLYVWVLCRGTAEGLREWVDRYSSNKPERLGIPSSKGPYYWCSSNKIKEIIG